MNIKIVKTSPALYTITLGEDITINRFLLSGEDLLVLASEIELLRRELEESL